ncbi:MAG: YfhL family 4Fe-4S dicluster ferredoxin [Rhodospirillales bacterium]|jgi:ferredoxin|nr:YfhL family 4Fe-4S dicluster ferredoxin [Rhodospirillales bacterium]|tara:strand:+ start:362 stop:607 length:246 start_codon:yes stop_codon:yes gene_type:complete
MALSITEDCTACDACVEPCPNSAISVADPIFVIDSELCTECVGHEDEPQCMLVCPADCIIPDPAHPETQDELLAKYQSMHG